MGMIRKGAVKFGARLGYGKVQLRAARYREMKSSKFSWKSRGAVHTYVVIHVLLLTIELCNDREHDCEIL